MTKRDERDRERARRFAANLNHLCQVEDAIVALIREVRAETYEEAAKMARAHRITSTVSLPRKLEIRAAKCRKQASPGGGRGERP